MSTWLTTVFNWECHTQLDFYLPYRSFCRLFYPTDPPSQEPDKSQYAKWLPSKDYAVGYAKFMGFNFSAPVASMLLNFLLGKGLCAMLDYCFLISMFFFFLLLLVSRDFFWKKYASIVPNTGMFQYQTIPEHLFNVVYQYHLILGYLGMGAKFGRSCPTNRPQPKDIMTIVIIKLKLWLATGCEAKVVAKLSSCPLQGLEHGSTANATGTQIFIDW